jgi:hypothetical protein
MTTPKSIFFVTIFYQYRHMIRGHVDAFLVFQWHIDNCTGVISNPLSCSKGYFPS